jgi:hypothetical protein
MARSKASEEHDDQRPQNRPDGRDRAAIIAFLQARIAGGPVPTPEMYSTALAHWQELPGALIREPGTVAQTQKALSSDTDGETSK